MKWLRTLNSFKKFKVKIEKSTVVIGSLPVRGRGITYGLGVTLKRADTMLGNTVAQELDS